MDTSLCDIVGEGVPAAPQQYRLLPLLMVAHQNLMSNPTAKDPTRFGHRTWRNQAGTDPEAPSLLVYFHILEGAIQAGGGVCVWEVIINFTQLWTLRVQRQLAWQDMPIGTIVQY